VVSTNDGFNGEVEPAKNQEPTQLELGDGVVLKESVFRSAKGDVRMRMTTISRNDERLMGIIWSATTKNEAGHTLTKAYWRDSNLILSEGDEDGDGVCELMVLHGDDGGPRHAFDVRKDGGLAPVGKKRLDELKSEYEWMLDVMTPIAEGAKRGVDKQESRKLVEEAIEKAKERAAEGNIPKPE